MKKYNIIKNELSKILDEYNILVDDYNKLRRKAMKLKKYL